MNQKITHKNIFETIFNSLTKEGLFPTDIDYASVNDDNYLNDELKQSYFDDEYESLMFKLNYGCSEGVYLDVYICDTKIRRVAVIKSLSESKEGFYEMAQLEANIILKHNQLLKQIRSSFYENSKYEYCVLDDSGNNVDCFEYSTEGYNKAKMLVKEYPKGRVMKVEYDHFENEISCMCILENE